ncbi:DegV family protein [Actinomyces bowdenii]|uniref:DegV family EDD domain-containing protein n=1 Tax=Actinomyces bowdenii TaxID=131109 RepID=A0A3P1V3V1_9ACTO|nr:DegV family protein [Actinomyces bowdenii]RRD27283.1 DegV family EDD domain-containing protein [Actinomyces bowdenii]
MPIAVVTDSAACLTRGLAQDHGIEVVALHIHTDDAGAPTTSRPGVEELAQAYRAAARRSPQVLALHLSASLSGTLDNARLAAQQVNAEEAAHVEVIDSGTCSAALALAALAASGAQDLRHGAALAHESAARSHQFFIIDSLSALARSGRIDRTTARLGGVLGIRPILEVAPAGIRAVETVRGAARARRHLIDHAVRAAGGTALSGPRPPAEPVRLAIQGEDPTALDQLSQELRAALEESGAITVQMLTLPIDEALRIHLGPGALGIAVAPALG